MFYLFFQDWFELSQPDTKCPFSDFLVACTRSTRELYVAYGFWWIKKWEAANQAPEADH